MKRLLIVSLLLQIVCTANAQNEEAAIKQAVNQLFTAMQQSDSNMLKAAFLPNAILQRIDKKSGEAVVITESVAAFAVSISKVPSSALNEVIVFETISVKGDIANVWTPYKFYYNGKFSHCGVNNFILVKQSEGWKIQYLIDTREKKGCE